MTAAAASISARSHPHIICTHLQLPKGRWADDGTSPGGGVCEGNIITTARSSILGTRRPDEASVPETYGCAFRMQLLQLLSWGTGLGAA